LEKSGRGEDDGIRHPSRTRTTGKKRKKKKINKKRKKKKQLKWKSKSQADTNMGQTFRADQEEACE